MDAVVSRIIYILVGLAAIVEIFSHKGNCKHCEGKKGGMKMGGGMPQGGGQPGM